MTYLINDVETTIIQHHGRKASQFHPDNFVVYDGYRTAKGENIIKYYPTKQKTVMPITDDIKYLVGFNYKFDLLWSWRNPELQEYFKRGGQIWDCQYAEYLLEGQTPSSQMCSLNDLSAKYGGTPKIDAIKELWERGVCTTEIDRELIEEYLEYDLINTEIIFLAQVKRAQELGMLDMIKLRMDGLLATTEMEYNGLHVDREAGMKKAEELLQTLKDYEDTLNKSLPERPPEHEWNWGSGQQVSCLLFGGALKYQKVVHTQDEEGNYLYTQKTVKYPLFDGVPQDPELLEQDTCGTYYMEECTYDEHGNQTDQTVKYPDTFKSGKNAGMMKTKNVKVDDLDKPKTRKEDFIFTLPRLIQPKPEWAGKKTDAKGNPVYSTSKEIIVELAATGNTLAKLLYERNKLHKDLSTYYYLEQEGRPPSGMLTFINEYDGLIHHGLNHTETVTGRLSSSKPNLQNVPRKDTSDVKQLFITRFGKDGSMLEVDYSQLEVVVKGVLSRDAKLMQDLRDRVDFHCMRVAAKHGISYEKALELCKESGDPKWETERTKCKSFSFQRAYGAGAAAIALATGMTKEEVEELIVAEENMYGGVVKFDKSVSDAVHSSAELTSNYAFVSGKRITLAKGQYVSPTGTRYSFQEAVSPTWMHKKGVYTSFSPTCIKNYPTQGFGGEIVQTMLGVLWRKIFLMNDNFNGKALLVNTVHDCVWLDVQNDVLPTVATQVKTILEAVPLVFNRAYPDLDIEVPFPVDAEYGYDLFNMKHI